MIRNVGDMRPRLPQADFGTTSRLAGRKPSMRSSVRLRMTSGLPVIRHLGHWRRVYSGARQTLEIVLAIRLHLGRCASDAAEL